MNNPPHNPWLSIPAADYEGHMASPGVRQLQYLGRVFAELLVELRPESVAVLGVAAGNGLEHVDPRIVKRVVGIDINPEYLDLARERHAARIPGLELRCADIAACELEPASIDFVYAALIFEYVDPAETVGKIASWLRPGGVAAALLQLPCESSAKVSGTAFASLKALEPHIRLVDPSTIRTLFAGAGMSELRARTDALEGGKSFHLGLYRRRAVRASDHEPSR